MNSRRTVIIAVALILAAIVGFSTVYFLNNAQQKAYKNAELVEVFVVKKPIPKGMQGQQALAQDLIGPGEIPTQFRPGTALTKRTVEGIKNKVALVGLAPGQVVVDGQFVDPNVAQVTFSQRVPAGQVAVTISVDQVHGVAGLLLPGDKINMLAYNAAPANGQPTVRVLYQNVNILAIGNKPAPQAGESAAPKTSEAAGDGGMLTLAVPLEAAMKVAYISNSLNGWQYHMTLVPPDNQPIDPAPTPISGDNALFANPPTPYPANGK